MWNDIMRGGGNNMDVDSIVDESVLHWDTVG